mmetsp:Transcript_606/g.1132  ORF Transcript_606/g.1132 Transcript_606/m.1132 type:complete len:619 (-) Transcript_606:137-1993(-)
MTTYSTLLRYITPINYLLFLTTSVLLFLAYLVLPRGFRAEYCGAGKRRYRRRRRRDHAGIDDDGSAILRKHAPSGTQSHQSWNTPQNPVVPRDVLESIYAHSHSYSHEYTGSVITTPFTMAATETPATRDTGSTILGTENGSLDSLRDGSAFGNVSSVQSSSHRNEEHKKYSGNTTDEQRGIAVSSTPSSPMKTKNNDQITPRVGGRLPDATPRLGMPRPPSHWKVAEHNDLDSLISPNKKNTHQQSPTSKDTQQQQIPTKQQLLMRNILSHPPGIRLIAHGTKCNPRPVWITLHYHDTVSKSSTPTYPTSDASTPFNYQNCLTWRAELRSSSSSPSILNTPSSPFSQNSRYTHQSTPNSHITNSSSASKLPKLGNLRTVPLTDILGVELGKRTVALRRVQTARLVKEEECFSLLTRNGTLDLECVSVELDYDGAIGSGVGSQAGKGNVLLSAVRAREEFLFCLHSAMASKGMRLNGLANYNASNRFGAVSGTSGVVLSPPSSVERPGKITASAALSHINLPMSLPLGSRDDFDHLRSTASPIRSYHAKTIASSESPAPSTSAKSIGEKLKVLKEQPTKSQMGSKSGGIATVKLAPSEEATTFSGKTSGSATISTVSF